MDTTSMNSNLARLGPKRAHIGVLITVSITHLLNDMIQSLIPAIYPIIKQAYSLDYGQIGLVTLSFQVTASLLQPGIGFYTDRHPMPYATVLAMTFSLVGLLGLAYAASYSILLLAAVCIGLGSSIFHPEATRMVRHASGGKLGFAQGIFQVGGQTGTALGPLLAAVIIVPLGQASIAWFSLAALAAMILTAWTAEQHSAIRRMADLARAATASGPPRSPHSPAMIGGALAVLIILLFSKNAYTASFTSFYTFYLLERFNVSLQMSQLMLFLYLASSAIGVLVGGIVGDRVGRQRIIWLSILGALPFALMLPYANLIWTGVLTVVVNLIMASAFGAILIYAMELLPHRIGMIGGLFYGLTFGLGGLAAVLLGMFADGVGVTAIYHYCSFIPAIGLLAIFLPRIDGERRPTAQ